MTDGGTGVQVTPEAFTLVNFDRDEIAELVAEARARVPGIDVDVPVELRVAEDQATSRVRVVGLDPITFEVDGGALEDYREPRCLGRLESLIALTRLFLEVADRQRPGFDGPQVGDDVPLAHTMAWDTTLYGRVAAGGLRLHQPRFRYNFRNRHGFSDVADAVFDELWRAGSLPWPRIVELSDRASAAGAAG